MTLAVAWVRSIARGAELIFASDSRLSQAGTWDSCPKIFSLPRSDAVMAFAGDTLWAYPIIAQTINDVAAFPPSRGRRLDLRVARGHALRVINEMVKSADFLSNGLHVPRTEFLLGGWSWEGQQFVLWRFSWNETEKRFTHAPIGATPFGVVRFIGDRDRDETDREPDPARDLVAIARESLYSLLRTRDKTNGPLDMEPFEVLVEMLRSGKHDTIGGPPQVAKIYRHMNTQFFGVKWPDRDGSVTYVGRELLDYEQLDIPLLDPDDPTTLPRQAAAASPVPGPGLDELLVPALEELGKAGVADLVLWSSEHGYEADDEVVLAWIQDAEARGVIELAGDEVVLREVVKDETVE